MGLPGRGSLGGAGVRSRRPLPVSRLPSPRSALVVRPADAPCDSALFAWGHASCPGGLPVAGGLDPGLPGNAPRSVVGQQTLAAKTPRASRAGARAPTLTLTPTPSP